MACEISATREPILHSFGRLAYHRVNLQLERGRLSNSGLQRTKRGSYNRVRLMNGLRFSQALVPGLIAGILSIFTSWLWMGVIFHRFQKLTPGTWRRETGQSYFLSSALHILAACGIAFLFTIVVHDQSQFFSAGIGGSVRVAIVCWSVFALPIILEGAIFINLHPLVVLGRLLDWLSTSLPRQ